MQSTPDSEQAAAGFDRIEDILTDLAAGRMVVIVDDEDRENEGDLLMAASLVRPEDINFMARFGRGLICLTLTRERCAQLRLPLMVHRSGRWHHHRYLGLRSRAHRACGGGGQRAPRRFASTRSHLSVDGAARWRADARWPH